MRDRDISSSSQQSGITSNGYENIPVTPLIVMVAHVKGLVTTIFQSVSGISVGYATAIECGVTAGSL